MNSLALRFKLNRITTTPSGPYGEQLTSHIAQVALSTQPRLETHVASVRPLLVLVNVLGPPQVRAGQGELVLST